MARSVPVIDLFAGPGGLGEGFSRFQQGSSRLFDLRLAIEKDPAAWETLRLRAFYRSMGRQQRFHYLERLHGRLTTEELFALHPAVARTALAKSWLAELGEPSADIFLVRSRVKEALGSAKDWVLLGGPPCQAYSLIGRSRNKGVAGYVFENDRKATLYLEYLQLIADFWPAVFVMENVKGLLSARSHGSSIFERMLDNLSDPARSIAREGRTRLSPERCHQYLLFTLADTGRDLFSGTSPDPHDYLLRAEEYGVPQSRHRVIVVGVRQDFTTRTPKPLQRSVEAMTLRTAISDLPPLRSGVSRDDSPDSWIGAIEQLGNAQWQKQITREAGGDVAHAVEKAVAKLERSASLTRSASGVMINRKPALMPWWFESDRASVVWNHEARAHMASDLRRYLFAAAFASVRSRSPEISEFPSDLRPAHRNITDPAKGTDFSDRFRVQLWNRPATTITSHISKDGHYYIHPSPRQCRSLTVREAARLQTFPDTYFFAGNRTSQYVQVGNAVPPYLALKIAESIASLL